VAAALRRPERRGVDVVGAGEQIEHEAGVAAVEVVVGVDPIAVRVEGLEVRVEVVGAQIDGDDRRLVQRQDVGVDRFRGKETVEGPGGVHAHLDERGPLVEVERDGIRPERLVPVALDQELVATRLQVEDEARVGAVEVVVGVDEAAAAVVDLEDRVELRRAERRHDGGRLRQGDPHHVGGQLVEVAVVAARDVDVDDHLGRRHVAIAGDAVAAEVVRPVAADDHQVGAGVAQVGPHARRAHGRARHGVVVDLEDLAGGRDQREDGCEVVALDADVDRLLAGTAQDEDVEVAAVLEVLAAGGRQRAGDGRAVDELGRGDEVVDRAVERLLRRGARGHEQGRQGECTNEETVQVSPLEGRRAGPRRRYRHGALRGRPGVRDRSVRVARSS
jgi:hypothetical protein